MLKTLCWSDVLVRCGPNTIRGMAAIARLMRDGRWHRLEELVQHAMDETGSRRTTFVRRMGELYKAELVERYGTRKNRRYRLVALRIREEDLGDKS